MSEVKFKNHILFVKDREIHFNGVIEKILILEEGIAVLLYIKGETEDIYFINHDGSFRWRIDSSINPYVICKC